MTEDKNAKLREAVEAAREDLEDALEAYFEARWVGADGKFYGPAVRVRAVLNALDSETTPSPPVDIYVYLVPKIGKGGVFRTQEAAPGVLIDWDENGHVLGVEVLGSLYVGPGLSRLP